MDCSHYLLTIEIQNQSFCLAVTIRNRRLPSSLTRHIVSPSWVYSTIGSQVVSHKKLINCCWLFNCDLTNFLRFTTCNPIRTGIRCQSGLYDCLWCLISCRSWYYYMLLLVSLIINFFQKGSILFRFSSDSKMKIRFIKFFIVKSCAQTSSFFVYPALRKCPKRFYD